MKGDLVMIRLKDAGGEFRVEAAKAGRSIADWSTTSKDPFIDFVVQSRSGKALEVHSFARSEVLAILDYRAPSEE